MFYHFLIILSMYSNKYSRFIVILVGFLYFSLIFVCFIYFSFFISIAF